METPTSASVRRHYEAAQSQALKIVEAKARAILRKHPNLTEFVMSMGLWSFVAANGDSHLPGFYTTPKYINDSSLTTFICDWDKYLKLTGCPMRFTATGKKITDW